MNMREIGIGAVAVAAMAVGCVAAGDPNVGEMDSAALRGLEEFERGATSDETSVVLDLLGRSPFVSLGSIGESHEGRPIRIGVIADPPVAFDVDVPAEGSVGDRLVVLLFGSIHAGELCGTDALLRMMHDIVGQQGEEDGDLVSLLEDLVICVVPIYNVDGHAKFAVNNRPGQNGPAQMGERANAQGLDLNRDWVKMDAPETRAMVRFLNNWDPAVIVDTHTTNGSNHRFTLTYQGPKHPAGSPVVVTYVREEMLPRIDAAFEAATGYASYFYGNFAENHTKWTTYPAEPWYGVAYRGIRNRLSILTEAYAYAPFEDRVLSTQAFCEAILRDAAANKREIETILSVARRGRSRTGRSGRAGGEDGGAGVRGAGDDSRVRRACGEWGAFGADEDRLCDGGGEELRGSDLQRLCGDGDGAQAGGVCGGAGADGGDRSVAGARGTLRSDGCQDDGRGDGGSAGGGAVHRFVDGGRGACVGRAEAGDAGGGGGRGRACGCGMAMWWCGRRSLWGHWRRICWSRGRRAGSRRGGCSRGSRWGRCIRWRGSMPRCCWGSRIC